MPKSPGSDSAAHGGRYDAAAAATADGAIGSADGTIRRRLNALLDRLARPSLSWRFGTVPTFKAFALGALATAALWLVGLAPALGLERGLMAAAVGGAVLALTLALALTEMNNYRMQTAVLGGAALGLWAADAPILPYLDLLAVALGFAIVVGRFGCFAAGCCHGRPCSIGARYGDGHREVGLPRYLVGVRLLPVPLLEAAYVLGLSVVALATILRAAPSGTALSLVVLGYAAGRFGFELLRGDAGRPYRYGLSEAQRISVGVSIGVFIAATGGVLPYHPALPVVAAVLCLAAAAIVFREQRGLPLDARLRRAHAIRELAQLIDALLTGRFAPARPAVGASDEAAGRAPEQSVSVPVADTSFGLRISAERLHADHETVHHYACSRDGGVIPPSAGRTLARLVRDLRHPGGTVERIGDGAVIHLLVRGDAAFDADRDTVDSRRHTMLT